MPDWFHHAGPHAHRHGGVVGRGSPPGGSGRPNQSPQTIGARCSPPATNRYVGWTRRFRSSGSPSQPGGLPWSRLSPVRALMAQLPPRDEPRGSRWGASPAQALEAQGAAGTPSGDLHAQVARIAVQGAMSMTPAFPISNGTGRGCSSGCLRWIWPPVRFAVMGRCGLSPPSPRPAPGWHRVDAAEIWQYAAGEGLSSGPGTGVRERRVEIHRLGGDVMGGDRPQVVVPAGAWQAARPLGA